MAKYKMLLELVYQYLNLHVRVGSLVVMWLGGAENVFYFNDCSWKTILCVLLSENVILQEYTEKMCFQWKEVCVFVCVQDMVDVVRKFCDGINK